MPKPRYKTTNWKQYNQSLINRGSLTFWIDKETISGWAQSKHNKRGRPRRLSDLAITTALMVKRVFSMSLRALQGFVNSIFRLAHVPLSCPQYTCISRRAKQVKTKTRKVIQPLGIDATGLKVYCEGECKKHGTDNRRRVWRRLHIAVDISTHEIIAAELSLSTVTGAIELIPSREGAAFWERFHPRNLAAGCKKLHCSNKYWKKWYGDHKRLLSETMIYRAKQLLGGLLSLRDYNAQVGETYAMIKA